MTGYFGNKVDRAVLGVAHMYKGEGIPFDPEGIMNPGVILPVAGRTSLANLKVGADAEEIPESIERQLRGIESSGEWNVAKNELVAR